MIVMVPLAIRIAIKNQVVPPKKRIMMEMNRQIFETFRMTQSPQHHQRDSLKVTSYTIIVLKCDIGNDGPFIMMMEI